MLLFEDKMRLTPYPHPEQLRYAIFIDTSHMAIRVISFSYHQELIELILSEDFSQLQLYKTQYEPPSDEQLLRLNSILFNQAKG